MKQQPESKLNIESEQLQKLKRLILYRKLTGFQTQMFTHKARKNKPLNIALLKQIKKRLKIILVMSHLLMLMGMRIVAYGSQEMEARNPLMTWEPLTVLFMPFQSLLFFEEVIVRMSQGQAGTQPQEHEGPCLITTKGFPLTLS